MNNKKCVDCGKEFKQTFFEQRCQNCSAENELRVIKENLGTSDEDTFSENFIVCPYCGHAFEPVADGSCDEAFIDGVHELECDECEKTFILTTCVSYDWETERL